MKILRSASLVLWGSLATLATIETQHESRGLQDHYSSDMDLGVRGHHRWKVDLSEWDASRGGAELALVYDQPWDGSRPDGIGRGPKQSALVLHVRANPMWCDTVGRLGHGPEGRRVAMKEVGRTYAMELGTLDTSWPAVLVIEVEVIEPEAAASGYLAVSGEFDIDHHHDFQGLLVLILWFLLACLTFLMIAARLPKVLPLEPQSP